VRVLLARLAPYRLLLGGIGLAVVAYVAYVSLRGTGLSGGLGAYSATTSADYSAREAARWVVFHLGDLAFATAFLPAMAFLLVTFTCLRHRGTVGPRARIFVAVALPAVLLLSVQVGLFASSFSLRVEERNLFHVMPLLLLGLVVWLDAGLPRPLRATAVAAAIPPALVLALPFGELLNSGLVNDTFGLVPLLRVAGRVAGGVNDAVILVGLGGILAVVVFAGARRAIAAVLAPALVLAFLVASSRDVFAQVKAAQFGYRYAPSVGADANWIDRAVGPSADVAYLATPNPDPGQATLILWQTDFFNRSVRRAYLFAAPAFQLDPATGRVVTAPDLPPVTERFVVASKDIGLAGRMLVDRHPVALYEVTQPLAAAHTVEGVFPDGWTGPAAAYNQYVAPPEGVGTMLVLPGLAGWSGPEIPVTVTVRIGPLTLAPTGAPALATETDSAQVTLTTGERRALVLTAPPPPFRVELSVDRTRRPADYGSGDTRELGVQVVFRAAS
jgi:hypothetical protein